VEIANNVPTAANDRCIVARATPFHRRQLEAVLEAADAERVSALTEFDAADLLAEQDVFIAYVADEPIGCIMAMSGPITVIHGLFVVPAQRGRGYGCELIRAALPAFEQSDVRREYWTAIEARNDGARERFIRFGFSLVPELSDDGIQLMTRRRGHPTTSFDGGSAPLAVAPRHPVRAAMAR